MSIKYLQQQIHVNAVNKGFWECSLCDGEGAIPTGHRQTLVDCPQCEATGLYRNRAESIALIHSELSEALEAARQPIDDPYCDKCHGDGRYKYEDCIKCGGTGVALGGSRFAEELADALIRILDLAGGEGINLEDTIKAKMHYNSKRGHKHGKAF